MHNAARQWIEAALAEIGPGRVVLEIGSREVNGGIRDLFVSAPIYVGIDIEPGPGVDVVADGATYSPLVRPDRIICCEVLEHAQNAAHVVAHAWAELTHGGWLLVTAANKVRPPHSAVDGGPLRLGEFYRGVSSRRLREWLDAGLAATKTEAFRLRVEEDDAAGDIRLLAQKSPKA